MPQENGGCLRGFFVVCFRHFRTMEKKRNTSIKSKFRQTKTNLRYFDYSLIRCAKNRRYE